MAANNVVLILGAGPRIGASVAGKFASNGYKVAVASRSGSGTKNVEGILSLKADFAKPDSIPALFDAVKTEFHTFPNVVIYNAASLTNPPDKDSVLSVPADSVASDLNVNTVSPYVAAQQAIRGWETLPKETKKSFIYTGNILNVSIVPAPLFLDLGMGKSASAYWIGVADASYSARGFRFFYADERQADGKIIGAALDGAAHGEFYAQLANHEGNVPWNATFVKSKGYVQFK
ncbi:NAD(P)-binding protein [Hypoxylon sp. FL1857]|nr:NAD(P)-binding protein [Hypoxylon sp. FL1857]